MNGIAFEDQFLGFLDGAIRQQKRMADRVMVQFIVLRLLMVVASASLPALTTIENRVWSTVAAVLVAVLTGLDTQFRALRCFRWLAFCSLNNFRYFIASERNRWHTRGWQSV